MHMKEFNATALRSEDGDEITFDVRPFEARQGDAVDSYLYTRFMHLKETGIGKTNNLVVLLCDATAQIPASADIWLTNLNASGQRTEIRRARSSLVRP